MFPEVVVWQLGDPSAYSARHSAVCREIGPRRLPALVPPVAANHQWLAGDWINLTSNRRFLLVALYTGLMSSKQLSSRFLLASHAMLSMRAHSAAVIVTALLHGTPNGKNHVFKRAKNCQLS